MDGFLHQANTERNAGMIILTYLIDLFTSPIFLSTVLSWAMAQLVKYLLLRKKSSDMTAMLQGGGMPSSHTATVTGLAVSTMIVCGTGGFEFTMALFFQIIVIFDALNVRYQCGQIGKLLNHESETRNDSDPCLREVRKPRKAWDTRFRKLLSASLSGLSLQSLSPIWSAF